MGSVNSVVVGENVGAVYASGLDRMVGLGVEHCVYFAPTHFPSIAKNFHELGTVSFFYFEEVNSLYITFFLINTLYIIVLIPPFFLIK